MRLTKAAEKIMVELVNTWERSPALLSEPGFGADIWDLAALAGIAKKDEAEGRRQAYFSGGLDDLPSVLQFMKDKGWIRTSDLGEYGPNSPALYPTLQGIEYVRSRRPKLVRFMNAIGQPTTTIIVSVITSAITAIVVSIVSKWLGKTS